MIKELPLLVIAMVAVSAAACRTKPGGTCRSEGEARCAGDRRMLVCTGGQWSAVACLGPKGCVGDGRFVECDESLARAGEPCGSDGLDSLACSSDGHGLLRCNGHVWQGHRSCGGPKGCQMSARFVDCDDSIASVGDRCDEGDLACSVDGTAVLRCAAGHMVLDTACAPRRCRARDRVVDCD